jgi:hypothetical protein
MFSLIFATVTSSRARKREMKEGGTAKEYERKY